MHDGSLQPSSAMGCKLRAINISFQYKPFEEKPHLKKSIFYFESSTASFHPSGCSVGTLLPLTFRKGRVKIDGVLHPESICHPSKAAHPSFPGECFSLHFVHHANHGTFWATSVARIPCRNLAGPHLSKFSVLYAFKKMDCCLWRCIPLFAFWRFQNILSVAVLLWSFKNCGRLLIQV